MRDHLTEHREIDGRMQYRTRLVGDYGEDAWSRWMEGDYRTDVCVCTFCRARAK